MTGVSPGSPNAALSTAGRIGATAAPGRHPAGRAASGACAVAAARVRASQARRAPSRPRSLGGLQDHLSTGRPQGARYQQKVVKTAKSGTTVCVVSTRDGWTKLNDGNCCSAKYLSVEQQQQQCYYAVTDRKCGIGHGSCEQLGSGHCCTRWGWCGKSTAHCGSGKNQCRCEYTGKKPC